MLKIKEETIYDIRKNIIIILNGNDGFKLEDNVSTTLFKELVQKERCSESELIRLTLSNFLIEEVQLEEARNELHNFINQLIEENILEVS